MALHGINLGGWLIAERWMTPDLFDGVVGDGERAIGLELPQDVAQQRLKRHRDSFITEKDFRWIKAHGFDFVRLPVGYWLFEDADGFVSGEDYVQKAFRWAEKHNLKVLLDFHGLQGSQNGQDHSGQTGNVRFYQRKHRRDALDTVDYLTKRYGNEPALVAIELINEPKVRYFIWRLVNYYVKAYRIAQQNVRSDVMIIVSDAFQPLRLARALARKRLGAQLVLDVHLYQLFSEADKRLTYEQHLEKIETDWRPLLMEISTSMHVLVGEWSAALPIDDEKTFDTLQYERYYAAQRRVFDESVWAESYWSYQVAGGGPWSYRHMKSESSERRS